MSTKKMVRRGIENLFIKDENLETVRSAMLYLREIKEGKYDEEIVNVVCQHGHYSSFFDLYDAHIFSVIHKKIKSGKLYYRKIWVGSTPSQNHQVEENNRKLQGLPDPFQAKFIPGVGGGAEDDGYFESTVRPVLLFKMENGVE